MNRLRFDRFSKFLKLKDELFKHFDKKLVLMGFLVPKNQLIDQNRQKIRISLLVLGIRVRNFERRMNTSVARSMLERWIM